MDRFATIEKPEEGLSGEGVDYYSVRFEDEEVNEFEKFLNQFSEDEEVSEEFNDLLSWLESIKEYGARAQFFRLEQGAQALPPEAKYLAFNYKWNLRLYCCRIADKTVCLFNGAIKTANPDQNCPHAGPKFREANELVKATDQKIKDREIRLTEDGKLIVEDKELIL